MKTNTKKIGKTSVIPHRAMNKVSPWLMPQKQIVSKEFTGWRGGVRLTNPDNDIAVIITVDSFVDIGAKHGRMFHLANRVVYKNPNHEGTIHVDEVLDELGISRRHENRMKVVNILRECKGMTITVEQGKTIRTFSLLEEADYNKETGVMSITVSKKYYDALIPFKERFIDTTPVMKLRESSEIAIELSTYLQIRGGGVDSKTWKASPAKKVYHNDLVVYLCLVLYEEEYRKTLLHRAFKALENQGFPKYKRVVIDGETFWTCDIKAKPAKRYKSGEDFE